MQTLAPLRLNGDQLPEAAKFLTALTAFVMHRVLHADQGLGALMQDDVEIQRRLDCVGNIAQLDAEKILAMIYEEAQTEAQTQQQLNQCANSYAAIKAATNLY